MTMEGIISGGLGCGVRTPSWYTRVSSHLDWIECIMREVGKGRDRASIERDCAIASRRFPTENLIAVF